MILEGKNEPRSEAMVEGFCPEEEHELCEIVAQ